MFNVCTVQVVILAIRRRSQYGWVVKYRSPFNCIKALIKCPFFNQTTLLEKRMDGED